MIDDIKDLSVLEQEKLIARRRFASYFLKCIWGVFISTVLMTVFAIYLVSDFGKAFTPERAIATTGRTLTTFMLMLGLMLGLYGLNPKNNKATRDFWLTIITFVITFVLVITFCIKVDNRYAMPIAIASLVILQLISSRASVLTTAILSMLIVISFLFSNRAEDYQMARIVSAVICNALSPIIITFFAKKHFSRLEFLLVALLVPF